MWSPPPIHNVQDLRRQDTAVACFSVLEIPTEVVQAQIIASMAALISPNPLAAVFWIHRGGREIIRSHKSISKPRNWI